jgi:transcriptional regulator of arginine metabolism
MPAASGHQNARREALTRLLRDHRIDRQSSLVELLRAEGFHATQSSVSRDLRDLGAAKLKDGYHLPQAARPAGTEVAAVADFVRDLRPAGANLLILTTAVGAAQRVAVTLDRAAWPEIIGTVSGDDTIFVATRGAREQRRLILRLRGAFQQAST